MIKSQGRRSKSFVRINFQCIIFAVFVTIILRIFFLQPLEFPEYIQWGDYSVLKPENHYIILRQYSFFSNTHKNDIIQTELSENTNGFDKHWIIKGTAGDKLEIRDGDKIFINNKFFDIKNFKTTFNLINGEYIVPEEMLLVLGQNYDNQIYLHTITKKDIFGKALYRYLPFSERKFIYNS